MKVEAVSAQWTHFAMQKPKLVKSDNQEAKLADTVTVEPSPTQADVMEGEPVSQEKGVIRLLQEGHFKGVADVRLRINFQEELAALEQAEVKNVAGEKTDELLQAVDNGLSELVDAGTITEEQYDEAWGDFEQAVNDSKAKFLSGETAARETLFEEIQSAFTTLVETLSPAPAEEPQEPDITETNPIEPADTEESVTTETETPVSAITEPEDPFASLRQVFQSALEEMISSMSETQVLPPLSEASGKGGAYDKFLAIYNQMQGIPGPVESGEEIDTTA